MLVPLLAVAVSAYTCLAQVHADSPGSVEWFESRFLDAQGSPPVVGAYVEYTLDSWPIDPAVESLQHMEARLRGYPEHPDQQNLQKLRVQEKLGSISWKYRIWFGDEQHWRVCQDTNDQTVAFEFIDVGRDGKKAVWQMLDDRIEYFDATALPPRRDPTVTARQIEGFSSIFLASPFSIGDGPAFRATHADSTPDGWEFRVEHPDSERAFVFRGETLEEPLRVTEVEIARGPDAFRGRVSRFSDWRPRADSGEDVPWKIEQFDSAGRLLQRWTLNECRALEPGELESVIAPPDPMTTSDRVRDLSKIVELVDLAPSGDGIVRDAKTNAPLGSVPRGQRAVGGGVPYMLGWVAVGGCLVGLVVIRLNRRA